MVVVEDGQGLDHVGHRDAAVLYEKKVLAIFVVGRLREVVGAHVNAGGGFIEIYQLGYCTVLPNQQDCTSFLLDRFSNVRDFLFTVLAVDCQVVLNGKRRDGLKHARMFGGVVKAK